MNVLVTGGAGYIGSVTVRLLLDGGHQVTVFDNLERGHRAAVDSRARLIEGDLREAGQIADAMQTVRPDAVVHFAAYAYVGESMEDPGLYFRNNLGGGLNLVDGHGRPGRQADHLLLHLRDLRSAGEGPHHGGHRTASGESLR